MGKQRRGTSAVTVSVVLDKETKRLLQARADRVYGGDLAALLADLGREAERADAVDRLVARAGGSTLTDARRAEIDAEIEAGWRHARAHGRKRRSKRAA